MNIAQSGAGETVSVAGTLDTFGLSPVATVAINGAGIDGSIASFVTGFGATNSAVTFGLSGDNFFVVGSPDVCGVPLVGLPVGYASGGPPGFRFVVVGATVAGLGLVPGQCVFGVGGTDSITINIAAAPVPAPGALAPFGAGMLGLLAARRRRRAG